MKSEEISKIVKRGSVEAKIRLYLEYLAAYNLSSGEEEILNADQLERIEANYKKHSGRSEVIDLVAYFKAFTLLTDRLALYEIKLREIDIVTQYGYSNMHTAINNAILIEELAKTSNKPNEKRLELLASKSGENLILSKEGKIKPNYNELLTEIISKAKEAKEIAIDAAELIALLKKVLDTQLKLNHLYRYVATKKGRIELTLNKINTRLIDTENTLKNTGALEREIAKTIDIYKKDAEGENYLISALEALLNAEAIEVTPEEIKQFKSLGQ
jgi:hypothetical protein